MSFLRCRIMPQLFFREWHELNQWSNSVAERIHHAKLFNHCSLNKPQQAGLIYHLARKIIQVWAGKGTVVAAVSCLDG